jgi:transcriptional regulator with GAF, ATPase, and Fis domain
VVGGKNTQILISPPAALTDGPLRGFIPHHHPLRSSVLTWLGLQRAMKRLLLVLLGLGPISTAPGWAQSDGHVALSLGQLQAGVELDSLWKYHAGDQPEWAAPSQDDATWENATTLLKPDALPSSGWPHIGWFRLHIKTDSSVVDTPLALSLKPQFGASEVYLDGQLIYRFGRVGTSASDENTDRVLEPRVLFLSPDADHLIAIRHSNFSAVPLFRTDMDAGFSLILGTLTSAIDRRLQEVQTYRNYQRFFSGLLIAFALLHLSLFLLYRKQKTHLDLALLCGALTALVFINFQIHFAADLAQSTLYERLWRVFVLMVTLMGLRVVYALFWEHMPRQFWGFSLVGVGLAVAACVRLSLQDFVYLFVLVICAEILRVVGTLLMRQRSANGRVAAAIGSGAGGSLWIIPPGVIGFVLLSGYQILLNLDIFEAPVGLEYPYLFGVVLFLLSLSLYLSFDFAQTHRALESQLSQTRALSDSLLAANEGLERRVRERTSELEASNQELAQKNSALEEEAALRKALKGQLSMLSERETEHWGLEGFVGRSATVQRIFDDIRLLQENPATSVLITGENGTGKELIARAIHYGSERREGPFIPVNCASIPRELADSLLFGHLKGTFTGAEADRVGYFEMAHEGTLFLDELGEMPVELQPKLLRVLEDGLVWRVGAREGRKVDVRAVAATNVDLQRRIQEERFRADLYFRVARFTVTAPPLRERQEDIPLLAQHFLQLAADEMGHDTPELSPQAVANLMSYSFPGNVRELMNIIRRALIESRGGDVEPRHLHFEEDSATTSQPLLTLEEHERQYIQSMLEHTKWVIRGDGGAATLLGMKPSTLYSRMKKLGIERE